MKIAFEKGVRCSQENVRNFAGSGSGPSWSPSKAPPRKPSGMPPPLSCSADPLRLRPLNQGHALGACPRSVEAQID